MDEKRKADRIKSKMLVQYCCNDESGKKLWDISNVKNISEVGMCLQTGRSLELNSLVSLRLIIPSKPFDKIEVLGKIVSCAKAAQGSTWSTRIEFSNISENIKIIFREYVDWMRKHLNAKSNK